MKALAVHLFAFFAHLGGPGLVLLGVLDSSFLFMPLGNDLLMLGLTASHPNRLLYYAAMAALGSVLGCVIIDVICRKGGETLLTKMLSERRFRYVKRRMEERAGWALAAATLLPPPFPFTPFVAGAAAFEYPRVKLYGILGPLRLVRFTAVGLLAVWFGNRILHWAESPVLHAFLIGLVVISLGGSVYSIWHWIRISRRKEARA